MAVQYTIVVAGAAGAIGNLLYNIFEHFTSEHQAKVLAYLRPQTAQIIQKQGLALRRYANTTLICQKSQIITTLQDLQYQGELIFVPAVKMPDLTGLLDQVKKSQAKIDLFLVPQNGVEAEEMICDRFPEASVISLSITLPVEADSQKGFARITSPKGGIALAHVQWPLHPTTDYLDIINDVLALAEIIHLQCQDWREMKWTKLLLNLIGNAICAILDMKAQQIYKNPFAAWLDFASIREYFRLMRTMKINFCSLPGWPKEDFRLIELLTSHDLLLPLYMLIGLFKVAKSRGQKLAGLHQSVKNHQETEAPWYNGVVARRTALLFHADQLPCHAKVNEFLSKILLNPEIRKEYTHKPWQLFQDFRQGNLD